MFEDLKTKLRAKRFINAFTIKQKRALKDMFLALLDFRKQQLPYDNVCKKLDNAIYSVMREILPTDRKNDILSDCMKQDIPKVILNCNTLPYYIKYFLDLAKHSKKTYRHNKSTKDLASKIKCIEGSVFEEFDEKIREIHFNYLKLLEEENIDAKEIEKLIQNIKKTIATLDVFIMEKMASYTEKCELNADVNTCSEMGKSSFVFRYEFFTGYNCPTFIKNIVNTDNLDVQQTINDFFKNKKQFYKEHSDYIQKCENNIEKLFGNERDLMYNTYCCCLKTPVNIENYNSGITLSDTYPNKYEDIEIPNLSH